MNDEWQDISTAPTNGTKILICAAGNASSVGVAAHATHKWKGSPWRETHSLGRVCWFAPTHWQPLPAAKASAS